MKNMFLMSYMKAIALASLFAAFTTIMLFGFFAITEPSQKTALNSDSDEYMTLEDFNKAAIPEALRAIKNECDTKHGVYQNTEKQKIGHEYEVCVSNEAQIKRFLSMQEFGLDEANPENPSYAAARLQLGRASLQQDDIKSEIKSILLVFSSSVFVIFVLFLLGRIYFKQTYGSLPTQDTTSLRKELLALEAVDEESLQISRTSDDIFSKPKIGDLFSLIAFGSLRLIRGFFGLIFIIQGGSLILLSLQLLLHPDILSIGAKLLLGIAFLIVSGACFFGLRALINYLHLKNYGVSHPAFVKSKWAL